MTPTQARRRRLAASAIVAPALLVPAVALAPVLLAPARAVERPITVSAPDAELALAPLSTYRTGSIDEGASEIVAFHPATAQVFVVNADAGLVEVLDASDPGVLPRVGVFDAAGTSAADGSTVPSGAVANSVAVRADGLVAVALESDVKTDDGWLAFFDAAAVPDDGAAPALGAVRLGALPDMVALTPDGSRAVVANEGEPADDYGVDPEGSIAVVDLPVAVAAPAQEDVRTATFHAYEVDGDRELPDGVRVFGPEVNTERPVSANLEPEYAAIAPDSRTAYVTLQEANAIAVVDLDAAEVADILPLGTKDHAADGNGLDPSDRDGGIAIGAWPVLGLYMPDSIAAYDAGGATYLVTANEGDAREWGDYVEPARVADLGDDGLPPICADAPAAALTDAAALGRLNVTTADGLSEDGSCYEQLHSFGARSFSIWSADGELVFDSGDQLERIVAEAAPEFFNSNHTESNLDGRSDDKGPEPEAVTVGEIDGRTYAFVGFERVGGIAVFDVTQPDDVRWVTYVNNRDFSVSLEDADDPEAVLDAAGDLGPEGLAFVAAEDSPTGEPLLAVGNEVSGTTTLYAITAAVEPTPTPTPTGGPTPTPTGGPTPTPTGGPPPSPTDAPGADLRVEIADSVRAGATATARIAGAAPAEVLTATMFSGAPSSVDLGTVSAGPDGRATLTFVVPADAAPGQHTLRVEGPSSGTAEAAFTVLAADDDGSGGGDLPATGVAGTATLAGLALLAVAAGILMRRRAGSGTV